MGLITFSDKIDKMIPPKATHDHLFAILKELEDRIPQNAKKRDLGSKTTYFVRNMGCKLFDYC